MKINMYTDFTIKIPFEKRIELIKETGFDGVMLSFVGENKYYQFESVQKTGLEIENVHCPFDKMNSLIQKNEDTDCIMNRTLECIKACSEFGVKTMVYHITDGLYPPAINDFAYTNLYKILDCSAKRDVTVAFENIQRPEYLELVFNRFSDCKNAGFCYDVGHENCFRKSGDCLLKHGKRLCGLHIHDNDGVSDGHCIPFDGNIDYDNFLKRLKTVGYNASISLELYMNKSDLYQNYSPQEFVLKGFEAGKKLEAMYHNI